MDMKYLIKYGLQIINNKAININFLSQFSFCKILKFKKIKTAHKEILNTLNREKMSISKVFPIKPIIYGKKNLSFLMNWMFSTIFGALFAMR